MDGELDVFIDNAIKWANEHLKSNKYNLFCLAFVESAYEEGNNINLNIIRTAVRNKTTAVYFVY